MRRNILVALAAVAAAVGFAGLVHTVLVAANVAEPAATTVYGLTSRRLWASAAAAMTIAGAGISAVALVRPRGRLGISSGPLGATLGMALGGIGAINGGLNVALANGGPGTGNGVVGGAAAVVLGTIAIGIGGLALARNRRAV